MIGVLVTNLGTPTAPTPAALRRYLKEFLSDPRVVEIPSLLWWPILNGLILPTRSRYSAKLYQKIWTAEGSPLLINSQNLVSGLQKQLGESVKVVLGMRYGEPSIAQGLEQLREQGVNELVVLPLYPQSAGATTGSTFDAVAKVLQQWRTIPKIRFISHYFTEPAYIAALANTIRAHWQQHGQAGQLLFSFHGIPQRSVDRGDQYQMQCQATAQAVADYLDLDKSKWSLVFQSRFGRAKWLQPYCDVTLRELAAAGEKTVTIICPGFAVDCLETLEEITQLNRDRFLNAGGKVFHYIPALNDSAVHLECLTTLIRKPNSTE